MSRPRELQGLPLRDPPGESGAPGSVVRGHGGAVVMRFKQRERVVYIYIHIYVHIYIYTYVNMNTPMHRMIETGSYMYIYIYIYIQRPSINASIMLRST